MEKLSTVWLGLKSGTCPFFTWTDPFFVFITHSTPQHFWKNAEILYLYLGFGYLSSNSVIPCYTFMYSYAIPILFLL